MHRTRARLADGREIVYYDARAGRTPSPDPRQLPPPAPPSQIRHDPLLDELVTISAHRQDRTFLPVDCPLCPSRPGRATEIPDADYEVVVLENRFPSFAGERGRCEVLCFTAEHAASFATLDAARARLVVDAWADRTAALSALPGVEHVFCFENRGEAVGVTLHHPHGQIYGYPFVPPRVTRMLDVAARTPDLHARVLDAERAGPRVVATSAGWTAYVPAAARWPVEVHVSPNRHVPDLAALDAGERAALADVLLDVLGRLDALHGCAPGGRDPLGRDPLGRDPHGPGPHGSGPRAPDMRWIAALPYLACWYQAPVRSGRELLRLHLRICSPQRSATRLKYLAGSEAGMGAFLNDVVPEEMAERLRAARP